MDESPTPARFLGMRTLRTCLTPLLLLLLTTLGTAAEESDARDLQILSFNIRLGVAKDGPNHWDHRKPLVLDVFRDHDPDVAGLQEAWSFQIEAIREKFPHFALIGRSREEDADKGEWCPILYRKDRFSVVDSGTFWLSDTPGKVGSKSWGNGIPRICTWAVLEKIDGGQRFHVYNTHFDHRSQPSRLASAELCLETIRKREPLDSPAVFLGDLNAAEDNPAITLLNTHLLDTFHEATRQLQPPPGAPSTAGWERKMGRGSTTSSSPRRASRSWGGRSSTTTPRTAATPPTTIR